MFKFTYIDHNTETVVFVVETGDILEADKLYQQHTGKDVVKQPYVGCSFARID